MAKKVPLYSSRGDACGTCETALCFFTLPHTLTLKGFLCVLYQAALYKVSTLGMSSLYWYNQVTGFLTALAWMWANIGL